MPSPTRSQVCKPVWWMGGGKNGAGRGRNGTVWEVKGHVGGLDPRGTGMCQDAIHLPFLLPYSPWTNASKMAGADLRKLIGAVVACPTVKE